MNRTIALTKARMKFSTLVDGADRLSERFVVTKHGLPKAVIMSVEEFESRLETLKLLSNPTAVKALERGLKQAKAGKVRSFERVFGEP
ncbi:MAG: type II toxin-antitoxin system Phd/YefM family antitoxin [Nitrospiraceae bacterium]